jgi:murein DD-endopeptidase MepM/ murein hydrolase activator NlpD
MRNGGERDGIRWMVPWTSLAVVGCGRSRLLDLYESGGTDGPVFIRPVAGTVSSEFGVRADPFGEGWEVRQGLDYAAPLGAPVRAARVGRVLFAGYAGFCSPAIWRGYGRTILLDHGDGYTGVSAHLLQIRTSRSRSVATGEVTGAVGSTGQSTGPILHFEIRRNGRPLTL